MSAIVHAVPGGGRLCRVEGAFFRAVARGHERQALAGSRLAGRYSRESQPTLYLSASEAGVAAAMIAHDAGGQRSILRFQVSGAGFFDLRDPDSLNAVRAEAGDPLADWQEFVARGEAPPAWCARDWIERSGAAGLIDPSRRVPGLWHLVLFRWNEPGAPSVR